jgi:hypothetical protein
VRSRPADPHPTPKLLFRFAGRGLGIRRGVAEARILLATGLLKRAGLLVGTAVRPSQLSEAAQASRLSREFHMVEAEEAMKWRLIHRDPKPFAFHDGDAIFLEFRFRSPNSILHLPLRLTAN